MKITCWMESRPPAEDESTVTAVCADATVPAALLASAVYVVVWLGVTVTVPPLEASVYVVPSDPATDTFVALLAVTVRVSELPWVIVLLAAEIDTVGLAAATLIATWAVVLPCEFVAVAVYVVVAVGATVMVPPAYETMYLVPFDPATLTEAAFDAVTVSVSDCPEEMLLELAVMETVGAPLVLVLTVTVVFAEAVPPEDPVAVAV